MYFKWRKWNVKTKKDLSTEMAELWLMKNKNENIDYYSVSHPEKGFLNLYSTMGQEEDRSEIVALIMTDEERKFLIELLKTDRILQRKVKLVIKQMNSVGKTQFISQGLVIRT